MKHSNRLKKLIDFANVTDNSYLRNELELLDMEINISIADSKIETLKNLV